MFVWIKNWHPCTAMNRSACMHTLMDYLVCILRSMLLMTCQMPNAKSIVVTLGFADTIDTTCWPLSHRSKICLQDFYVQVIMYAVFWGFRQAIILCVLQHIYKRTSTKCQSALAVWLVMTLVMPKKLRKASTGPGLNIIHFEEFAYFILSFSF